MERDDLKKEICQLKRKIRNMQNQFTEKALNFIEMTPKKNQLALNDENNGIQVKSLVDLTQNYKTTSFCSPKSIEIPVNINQQTFDRKQKSTTLKIVSFHSLLTFKPCQTQSEKLSISFKEHKYLKQTSQSNDSQDMKGNSKDDHHDKYSHQISGQSQLKIQIKQLEEKLKKSLILQEEYFGAYKKIKQENNQLREFFLQKQQFSASQGLSIVEEDFNQQSSHGVSDITEDAFRPESGKRAFQITQIVSKTLVVLKKIIQEYETHQNISFQAISYLKNLNQQWKSAALDLKYLNESRNSQANYQLIHQHYKSIIAKIAKTHENYKKNKQKQFNRAMKMAINFKNEQISHNILLQFSQEQDISQIRLQSRTTCRSPNKSNLTHKSESKQYDYSQSSMNDDVIIQLQEKIEELKKTNEKLEQKIKKQDQQKKKQRQIFIAKQVKLKKQFFSFMQKVAQSNAAIQQNASQSVGTTEAEQSIFAKESCNMKSCRNFSLRKISQMIFEISQRIPVGNNEKILFCPENEQQLLQSLQEINNFCKNYEELKSEFSQSMKKYEIAIGDVFEKILSNYAIQEKQIMNQMKGIDELNHLKSIIHKQYVQRQKKQKQLNDSDRHSVLTFGMKSNSMKLIE